MTTAEKKLYLQRLQEFSVAATNLYMAWKDGSEFCDHYPFGEDFEETVLKISAWNGHYQQKREQEELADQSKAYRVWCEVWGGVTGSRQAWLKRDGKPVEFASMELAEQEAKRLNETTASYQRASYRYSAREYTRY